MLPYVVELLAVFLGVVLAFAVENFRETLRDRAVGRRYLAGFGGDFSSDLAEVRRIMEFREGQARCASVALEFFEGRSMDVAVFFPAFYAVLPSQAFVPRRNTMDEVLNAGHLHLIRDATTRAKVLDLYALYGRVAATQDHIERDYHVYLYDATFSAVNMKPEGPWVTDAEAVADAKRLVTSVTVANGLRLAVFNLQKVLVPDLRRAEAQLQELAILMETP